MNQYPAWKYLLISLILLMGVLYALPNLFGEDPALQVTSSRGFAIPPGLEATIEDALAVYTTWNGEIIVNGGTYTAADLSAGTLGNITLNLVQDLANSEVSATIQNLIGDALRDAFDPKLRRR